MEEFVGQIWHKYITRAATLEYKEASVELEDIRKQLSLQFRAFGGELAIELKKSIKSNWQGKRTFLSKLAGAEQKIELASVTDNNLYLPQQIACFKEKELNQQCYLWLSALLANYKEDKSQSWIINNINAINRTLKKLPGLKKIYQNLVKLHLEQRVQLNQPKHNIDESILQSILKDPESICDLKPEQLNHFDPKKVYPLILWIDPFTDKVTQIKKNTTPETKSQDKPDTQAKKLKLHKKGEVVDDIDEKDGLMAFRMESIFSWTEYVPVDRTADDEEEDKACAAAEDIDKISVVKGAETTAAKLKFDLDLPSEEQDDITINTGIKLPEWDYRKNTLISDYCRLHLMQVRPSPHYEFSSRLKEKAKRIRAQFEILSQQKQWLKAQPDGSEIDLDQFIVKQADKLNGIDIHNNNLYMELRQNIRSFSCLLLADLSLSTDSYVNNQSKVIDMIKDALYLFSEALSATQDRYAIAGFCSKKRDMVRYYPIKSFDDKQTPEIHNKIASLSSGYYTRMGAAIRHATENLDKEASDTKLLLLLSDGKPNDVDLYEGRYGIEDTKHAVRMAFKKGIRVFCVTIDDEDNNYLSYIFGCDNYVKIQRAEELPEKLTKLYTLLTR